MDLRKAEALANELMAQHLNTDTWRFEWDNSKRRFGVCKYRRLLGSVIGGVIGLSRHLVALNSEEQVRDTILHEIAHALTPNDKGHGWEWKQMCIKIGAKPERCYKTSEVTQPEMRYKAECGGCGQIYQRAKMTKSLATREYSCKCQRGKSWDERIILKFIDTKL